MKNGVCPVCGSEDIYYRPAKSFLSNSQRNYFQVSGFSTFSLESYVCKNCGLLQDFIPDENIEKVCSKLKKF